MFELSRPSRARRLMSALLAGVFVLSSASAAFAGAADRYLEQIAQHRASLQKHAEADLDKKASEEIDDVSKWLDEAEAAARRGDIPTARKRVKRAEYGLMLVHELVQVSGLSASVKKQKRIGEDATKEVAKMEKEIEALKKKKTDLKQQLDTLRK